MTPSPFMTIRPARKSIGKVTISPAAVNRGALMLSMSQFLRKPSVATITFTTRRTSPASTPPRTEMKMNCCMLMLSMPMAVEITLARKPIRKETTIVMIREASMFCRRMLPLRRESSNVPTCMAVPRRLPRAPKMLPRIPMAAGMRTISPGSISRVSVMKPRVIPARMSPRDEMRRAVNPMVKTVLLLEKNAFTAPSIVPPA